VGGGFPWETSHAWGLWIAYAAPKKENIIKKKVGTEKVVFVVDVVRGHKEGKRVGSPRRVKVRIRAVGANPFHGGRATMSLRRVGSATQ